MPEKRSEIALLKAINNGICGVAGCSILKTGSHNNMLEVIIMILGTIVISVIMLLVLLLVIVLILVSYDRYLARKMGKRRK